MRQQKLRTLIFFCALFFLPASLASANTSHDNSDEYDETSRVVRISLLSGTVSLKRSGDQQWERAALNLPLVEGDTLATEDNSRAEIQIDSRNFLRLSSQTVLRIVTLRDEGIALSVEDGTASLRLARFDRNKEYFEIDAPGVTVAAEAKGFYRLDVSRDGDVRATVRDSGRARVYSETSGFTLRDGRSAKLIVGGNEAGDWELSSATGFDEWDRWTDERERYLTARLSYEGRERYYDSDVWGAEELDAYGNWSYRNDYGWVWRPHVTVINNYVNWAPYRYGHWRWCPPYGWTWVGDEPWGWAPYHHGRWVYVDNDWCWAPRGYGYSYKRSWWRPALVAFAYVATPRGEYITWYPLGYGQRDPRGRYWQNHNGRDGGLSPLRRDEINGLQRVNPIYQRAVNALPAREFGDQDARARPAPIEIARRAITTEPLLGRLPVTPARASVSQTDRVNLEGVRISSTNRPARIPIERTTGAAVRAPGVSLDGELQRTRVYQGREPRRKQDDGTPAVRTAENNSGAVERTRSGVTPRPVFERRNPSGEDNRSSSEGNGRPAPVRRTDENRFPGERPTVLRSKEERGASAPSRNVDESSRPANSGERRVREGNNAGGESERPRPVPRIMRGENEDGYGNRNSVERRERPETLERPERREVPPVERPAERPTAPRQEERREIRERNYERDEQRQTVRPTMREERPQVRENPSPARQSPPPSSPPPSRGESHEQRGERAARPSRREQKR